MEKEKRLIPKHFYIPAVFCCLALIFAFYATRLFNSDGPHYNVAIPLDDKIPFVPAFIVFYVGAYAQWVLNLWLAAREGQDFYFRVTTTEILAKLIAVPIFLFFPTAMVRPEIRGSGFFESLTAFIYACDSPDNLFPSMHCMDSWLCLLVMLRMKRVPLWAKWVNGIFSVLVFASVVLVKQHLFLDIIGGLLLVEIAFLVRKTFRAERVMYRLVPKAWQS